MEPKFMISEVFGTSWKYTKSQIWVLVGLFIGYFILSSIISLFGMPAQGSMVGKIIVNLISAVISSAFMLGYIKNLFQTMDGVFQKGFMIGDKVLRFAMVKVAN